MAKINKRLQLVVDQIEPNSIIADIGTDHGYLPIMAVKQNKAKYAFAADINEKPLESAKENIKKANLEEKIDPLISNGLTFFINNNIKLNYVIISGLGASTIADIMLKDYDDIDNYLLCSNTEPSNIRMMAKQLNLFVKSEQFFYDNGRKYWLIHLNRNNGEIYNSYKKIYLGIDKNMINSDLYKEYLNKEYLKNKKILKVMKLSVKKIKLMYLNFLIKRMCK